MNKNDNTFFLLLVMAMAFWAGSWVSGKIAAAAVDPYLLIFWRFLITALGFLPLLFLNRKSLVLPDLRGLLFTLGAAVAISFYNYFFVVGLRGSLAGKGGVIVTTLNPILTFIFSTLIFRSGTALNQKIGLFIGIAGGVILMEPWQWQAGAVAESTNLYFLYCAFFWSVLTLCSQQAQQKIHPILFNTILYTVATVLMVFVVPEDWRSLSAALNLSAWLNIVYLALFAGVIGAGLYFYAALELGSSRASTFIFLVPVMALVFSRIFLGERSDLPTLAGGALSVTAVLIINNKIRIRRFQTSD
ncbi:MAG: DMT family transporter [Spirochaetales bacterium]|nr:DMT family transporter [Spirochaetales bacterium]